MPDASEHARRDPSPPPTRSPSWSARLAELQAEIASRLRPLCAAMPQAEFDALMRQMAERQLKYELREE